MEQFGLVFFYGITAFDDIRTKQVRTFELIVFAVIGVALNLINKNNSWPSVIAATLVGLFLALISLLSRGKLGMGDALIIAVSGLYLGFINTVVLVWLSSLIAAVYGIIRLRKYDNKKEMELPFVPFMLISYMTMLAVHYIGGVL